MTAYAHASNSANPARAAAPRHGSPVRISSGIAAVGLVAATTALAMYLGLPRAGEPTTQPPQPLPPSSVERAPTLANEVDWSRIEAAEDPGPMAIAAYGP